MSQVSNDTDSLGAAGTAPTTGGLREDAYHVELRERLSELTAPGYDDPARRDLSLADWLTAIVFIAAIAVGFIVWGY